MPSNAIGRNEIKIGEATGQRIDQWAAEGLFKPIGITEFYWKITPDGEADTEGGLYLATHDLARIGYLFLKGGQWEGKQILSEDWVRRSGTHTAIPWHPIPPIAMLPSGTLVEILCGQPEQKLG